ncbi:protein turtle A-like, partial [Clarias magur]
MPERTFLPTGMRGVISCPLVAEPPLLRVDWTKNGKALDLSAYPGWILTADGSIVITTVNDDAVGVYTCTPYNSYGTMGQSQRTTVVLQDPPAIALAPSKEYRAEVGRTLTIPCQAHGDPPPKVNWKKLSPSVSRPPYSVLGNGSLLLESLSKEHHGEWECSVTNLVSTTTATTAITVFGTSPHAVSSVSVDVGMDQANVSWVPGFDGGYTQSFTVWLKCVCTDEEHSEWRSAPGPSSSTSVLVTDLLPSTEYQFNVMAQNKLGSGPFSDITTARTMDTLPSSFKLEPPLLLSSNQSSEGLYLRWVVPPPQQLPIDSFVLQSRLEEGEWSTLDEDISANKTEMLVQGLQKNCNYELRLLSRRGEQLSTPSHSINVSTLVLGPPSSRLPGTDPQPLWTGIVIGMAVLCLLLLIVLVTVCIIGRKRSRRHRKMMRDHLPASSRKSDSTPDSPDSVLKQKLLPLRPLSSSSSSSDHSSMDKSNRNDGPDQKQHQLPQGAQGSVPGNQLHRDSTVDLIHRGPDGRFMVEPYEELSTTDSTPFRHEMSRRRFSRSSERPGDATLRKSQSLRSYSSERRHPPFVLSVDMPSSGLDISPSGRAQTLPRYGCYSVALGQEISNRSSLSSVISGSVLCPPSDNCPALKPGDDHQRASALVLQMEHEKEQGNLSHCLRLAREREELERELRKYTLDRNFEVQRGGSLRVVCKREIEDNGLTAWKSRGMGSLQFTQLPNRGQCLSSNTISPRGSMTSPGDYSYSQQHIFARMNHLGDPEQGGKAEKSRGQAGCETDYVEMCVDEPEIQPQIPLARSMQRSTRSQRPGLYQLQMETERQSGYKTIQRGSRRNPERMSRGSSSTLPSKHRQQPAFENSGGNQGINHHRSAPSLDEKMYSEHFLPPDAWIDSLNRGQNPSLSPSPCGEQNQLTQIQENGPCAPSQIQVRDSCHQHAANNASTADRDRQRRGPPSMPLEDSGWHPMHCYSPEPEGSCRSYTSHSSGRGSLDHPSSRQSLSFSPPLNTSLEIPEESDRDEPGQRSLQG